MKHRLPTAVAAILATFAVVALLVGGAVLYREVAWRHQFALDTPGTPSPDGAYVAEARRLPDSPLLAPRSTGVFVARRWQLLRSVHPQLVFAGACDTVQTRWMTPRRLVIECELREGEPRLLQALVDDVVVELVIQGRYGSVPRDAGFSYARTEEPPTRIGPRRLALPLCSPEHDPPRPSLRPRARRAQRPLGHGLRR
jgi:hypothetical protein